MVRAHTSGISLNYDFLGLNIRHLSVPKINVKSRYTLRRSFEFPLFWANIRSFVIHVYADTWIKAIWPNAKKSLFTLLSNVPDV